MAKPTNLAEWATGGGAPITEPLLAEKQAGWAVSFKPPAQWFNWWMKQVYLWIVWLDAFENTVHTWTALQTLNAGVLAPAFGATSGIRGTSAITNVAAVLGSATAATAAGVKGTSTHATGWGGFFSNTSADNASEASWHEGKTGARGIGTALAGIRGGLATAAYAGLSAGVLGESGVAGYPAVRGLGELALGGWGGSFFGADSDDNPIPAGLGLQFRGGLSYVGDGGYAAGNGMEGAAGDATGDGSLGVGHNGGTNTLRGGNVDGTLNDEGLAGVGLTLTGGSVIDDSNGRTGGTALVLVAGTAAVDGLALDATGDAEIDGRIRLMGGNEATSTAQVKQISPGLMCKAWARVRFTGGVVSLIAGQNVVAVGIQDAAQGRLYVDFAISIDKTTRCAVSSGDVGRSCTSLEEASGDALGRSDTRAIFRVASIGTGPDSPINLTSGAGSAYVQVFGL